MRDPQNVLRFGPFTRNRNEGWLEGNGQRIRLTRQALAVLDVLLDAAGELVTKETLIAEAWSREFVTDDALSKRLQELRRALGDDARTPRYIETVPRAGVRFIGQLEDAASRSKPLLGREAEVAQLMRWRREVELNQPLMVAISGEPGIGKSRLLEAFLESALETAGVLRGHCGAQGQLQPFMPVLTALVDCVGNDDDLRSALMTYAPTWARAIPELVQDGEAIPAHSQQRLLLELCTALDHMARERTLILAIEDIHWADASTLALLDYLARRRARSALMVLVTYREQGLAISTEAGSLLVNLVGRDSMRALSLTPFDIGTVELWMRQEFGTQGDAMAPLMYEHSLGLPLYLNWLIEDCQSRLDMDDGVEADTLRCALPESLARLFQIQLASLNPSERQIVEAGAVIGTPFTAATVATIMDLEVGEAETVLRRLLATGQLVHRTDVLNQRYQLAHELLRQAVYDATDDSRKMALHAGFADLLTASSNYDHSVLAHHYRQAGRWVEAIEAHVAAAMAARATHAALESIDHLEAAIDLSRDHPDSAPSDDELYSIHENLFGLYRTTHGYNRPRVHELADAIVRLGDHSENPTVRSRSLCVQVGHAMMCGRVPWGLDQADELERRTDAVGKPGNIVEANSLIGEAHLYAGNLNEAMARLVKSRDLVAKMPERERRWWSSGVHRLLALVQVELGQFSAASRSVEQGLSTAATPFQEAMCLYNGYSIHALHGDFEGSEPYVAKLEALVPQYDFMEIQIWASLARAMVIVETGDPETALRLTIEGRRLLEERGTNLFRGLVHMAEGRARARLGDAEGAYRTVDEGIEASRRQGEFGCLANVLFTRGEIGLWLGRAEAHDDLLVALEQARRNGSILWEVRDLAFLATLDPSRLPELQQRLKAIDAVPVDVRRITAQMDLGLT